MGAVKHDTDTIPRLMGYDVATKGLAGLIEFKLRYHLTYVEVSKLCRVFHLLGSKGSITKKTFLGLIGYTGSWITVTLSDKFAAWFIYKPESGVMFSPSGQLAFNDYQATIERCLNDDEYFEKRTFRYSSESERAARRAECRFYKDLTEEQQIQVLREYCAMPTVTKDQRKARNKMRVELYEKYDLIGWGIVNAIKRFGDVVKSARPPR